MNKIVFDDLKNIKQINMLGSESTLYTCSLNNRLYLYKQPNDYTKELANKMSDLININSNYLITPKHIIYGSNYQKPVGYLIEYLEDYQSLYYLKKSQDDIINILKKVKEAIIEMHKLGIIHCDLHPANIMSNKDNIKIIDFDTSKYLNHHPRHYNQYSAKYLENNRLNKAIDIYNFNIDTLSCIYNISWCDIFNFDNIINLNEEQQKVWQKTKEKKELTYDDFLIDRY